LNLVGDHLPEFFIGSVIIIGAVLLALHRLGWLRFENVPVECPVPKLLKPFEVCKAEMKTAVEPLEQKLNDAMARLIRLEEGQGHVRERLKVKGQKIDRIGDDVAFIRGYLEKNGKKGI